MSDLDFSVDLDADLGELRAFVRELRGANGELEGLDKRSRRALTGVDKGLIGAAGAGALFGAMLGTAASAAVDLGIAVARAAANAALDLGRMALEAAEFAQSMRLSLGMILRNEHAGDAAFGNIRKLAQRLGLDVRATTEQFRDLLAMQFTMSQATDIVKMSADMQALGADAQTVESVMRAITQIKGKGKLQMEELTTQLAEAKVSTELVVAELAKMRKVGPDAIRKMISAGQIGADEGVQAVQLAVMEKLGIKKLGEAGEKFADSTIRGMKNKLKGAWSNFWIDLGSEIEKPLTETLMPIAKDLLALFEGAEGKAAVQAVAGAIKDIAVWAKAAYPVVKELLGEFRKGFGETFDSGEIQSFKEVFKMFTGAGSKDQMEALRITAQLFGAAVGFAASQFMNLARAAALFVGIALNIIRAIETLIVKIRGAGSEFKSAGGSLGANIVDGIVGGITGGIGKITGAVSGAAQAAIKAFAGKDGIDAHSPSRVFKDLGEMSSVGYAEGVDGGAPQAARSLTSMVAPPSASLGGGSTTNQRNNITIQVTVLGGGEGGDIADQVQRGVERALDQLASETT